MNKLDVLRGAREIIADRRRWISGDSAIDEHGVLVDPNSVAAVRFCAVGALARVGDVDTVTEICASICEHEHHTLWWTNDNVGREAAIAVLDREIARCEAEVRAARPAITFAVPAA